MADRTASCSTSASPSAPTGLNDPPVTVQWHTGYVGSSATYNNVLGDTISLPAFFLNNTTSLNDYRLIYASGYGVTDGNTQQGRTLVTTAAASGALLSTYSTTTGSGCAQAYAALTDVATARDFAKGQNDRLIAGYFGDTAGQLWRYTLNGGLSLAYSFTCNQPLHFSPTVVQLDRDSIYSTHAHEIYLVQVTNSNLDLDTVSLPASKMIFAKEVAQYDTGGNLTGVAPDTTWGTSGQIVLTAGTNQICGVTHLDSSGNVVCDSAIPSSARPTSTPLGILKSDGNGFQVVTMWYATPSNVCLQGQTFLTVHQMVNGVVTQRLGYAVTSTNPATSPVIIGGQIFVFGGAGTFDNATPFLPDTIGQGSAIQASPYSGQFTRFNWTEVLRWMPGDPIEQVLAVDILQDQDQIVGSLEVVVKLDDMRVMKTVQEGSLSPQPGEVGSLLQGIDGDELESTADLAGRIGQVGGQLHFSIAALPDGSFQQVAIGDDRLVGKPIHRAFMWWRWVWGSGLSCEHE